MLIPGEKHSRQKAQGSCVQISELGGGGEGEPMEVSLVSLGKDRGSDPISRSVQGLRIGVGRQTCPRGRDQAGKRHNLIPFFLLKLTVVT